MRRGTGKGGCVQGQEGDPMGMAAVMGDAKGDVAAAGRLC